MAKVYSGDAKHAALKLYAVNHPTWGNATDLEYRFWTTARSLAGIPWGTARATQITAAAAAYSLTLNATSPWTREEEFWAGVTITPAA